MALCKNPFWCRSGLFIGFSVDNGLTEITMEICCYFKVFSKFPLGFSLPQGVFLYQLTHKSLCYFHVTTI